MAGKSAKGPRCAVYTRKSSEEGLDQAFNSLDAQREACEAYIKSQTHEGWRLIRTHYDDGGISGGTMERPALKRLLVDIEAGRVDVVVVYKVDRLTRSLADFAKIVEVFDARGASFVSVTQQFNTTTSMGRLTLNMLLSFAQFEREVTAERIRDKIAASKAKGIWMGGWPPLGYDVKERKLVINPQEALNVTRIYETYLEVGSVRLLKERLDREGMVTKVRRQKNGRTVGGSAFNRGHLYRLLSNPLYRGKLPHKDRIFQGLHEAVIDPNLWNRVQDQLRQNKQGMERGSARSPSLLAGRLYTADGQKLIPSHASKKGSRYRYYIAQRLTQHSGAGSKGERYAAHEVEAAVLHALRQFLDRRAEIASALGIKTPSPECLKRLVTRAERLRANLKDQQEALRLVPKILSSATVSGTGVKLDLSLDGLAFALGIHNKSGNITHAFARPCRLVRRGQELKFVLPNDGGSDGSDNHDPDLLLAVAKAHLWWQWLRDGGVCSLREIADREGLNPPQVTRRLRLAFLSPRLIEQILAGAQRADLTIEMLTRQVELPLSWATQDRLLA
jgi:DNA invertase Pin-like site-specific DNA recombinase